MEVKIIPIEERNRYRCNFCHTDKSVKYIIIDVTNHRHIVCNKCYFKLAGKVNSKS